MAVRRERVILELQDDFTTGMAKAAAATALLDKHLNSLSKSAVQSSKATRSANRDVDGLGKSSKNTEKEIDKLSGRLRIFGELAAVLGPSLVPIGALGIPAISGLTSALGFATVGLGSAALAFRGLGDAVKAVNKAQLEPTVENLQAAKDALRLLTPETRAFVREWRDFGPVLDGLTASAASGLFPGLGRGLNDLRSAMPLIEQFVNSATTQLGSIAEDIGQSFASGQWDDFLVFLGTEGPHALATMSEATGNLAHGLAGLWMATTPLNNGFMGWLVDATAAFDDWANTLGQTEGFKAFLDYLDNIGPQVGDTLGAVSTALIEITEAVAPLGGPSLRIIEAFANAVATIADSPLGTPILAAVSAMSALSLATRTYGAAQTRARSAVQRLGAEESKRNAIMAAGRRGLIRNGAALGALALVTTGVGDKMGLTNTASLALAGSLAGPWGTAIGGAIGLVGDLSNALGTSEGDIKRYQESLLSAAGPDIKDQLEAVTAAIKEQKAVIGDISGPDFELFGTRVAPFSFDNTWRDAEQKLDALKETQANLRHEQDLGKISTDYATSAQGLQAAASKRQAAALNLSREAARKSSGAFTAFGDDLDDSKVSLDKWIQGLQDQADALRNFARNSITVANRGLRDGLVDSLREQGPAGALRLEQLAEGGVDDIRAANKAWLSQLNARKRNTAAALELEEVAKRTAARRYNMKFSVDTARARQDLDGFNGLIARTIRPRTLNIKVAAHGAGLGVLKPEFGGGGPKLDGTGADGATVPKTGKPYADRHLWLVADGERIVSNRHGQVDRHAGLLDAIENDRTAADGNSGRTGGNPGLASYIRNDLDMKYPHTLAQWNAALKASTKVIETEKSKRQALLDQAAGVRSAITSGYKSDLFGESGSSVWMSAADRAKSGTGDVFSTLTGDIGNLKALQAATSQLKAKGLDGAALADLLSNGSLQDVQAFASGSKSDVARYESLYNQRANQLTLAGNQGALAAFGAQLAVVKAQLAVDQRMARGIDRIDGHLDDAVKSLKAVAPKRPKGKS